MASLEPVRSVRRSELPALTIFEPPQDQRANCFLPHSSSASHLYAVLFGLRDSFFGFDQIVIAVTAFLSVPP